jgi:membrane-bound lytic murein transglycosylase
MAKNLKCWLKDPFDLLAIQIEGSGRVILEDGTPLRVNYDSHNGYSFTSISRALIERNLIPREEMSMQRIREWVAAHPDEAAKVRAANRSYVFFRVTGLSNKGEPVGAQGVNGELRGGAVLRAERPRGARSVAAATSGASSENWQACGGRGWFVKPPRRRPFQELRDAVDLVVVSAVRKAE